MKILLVAFFLAGWSAVSVIAQFPGNENSKSIFFLLTLCRLLVYVGCLLILDFWRDCHQNYHTKQDINKVVVFIDISI